MNRLIIVEGLPCSGKSTTAKHIAESIKAHFYDEGCGDHPADHEFHAFIKSAELSSFSSEEQALIKQKSVQRTTDISFLSAVSAVNFLTGFCSIRSMIFSPGKRKAP